MPEKDRNIMLLNATSIRILKRLFCYGCYSAEDALELEKIQRFDRYEHFLKYAFGDYIEEIILETSGKKALHFRNDEFEMPFNVLLELYTMKKISKNDFVILLTIIQEISRNPERYYLLTDIINFFNGLDDTIGVKPIRNRVDAFVELGYLIKEKADGRTFQYRMPENILTDLSAETLYRVTALTDLCRNIYHPPVCGHYLINTLSIINQQKNVSYDTLFLCKHLHMGQVLEDEKLWKLLAAIFEKKSICICYNSKDNQQQIYRNLQPHKIIINETDGRRYLFCIILENGRNGGRVYRLGNILDIEIEGKENPLSFLSEEEADNIYHELFDKSFNGTSIKKKRFETGTLIYKNDFYYEIRKYFPEAVPEREDELHSKIHIEVNKLVDLRPWLRKNIGKVRLTDTSNKIAEELEDELKKWRAMYGIK